VQIRSSSAKGALKLCGQLWYLSEKLVAFALFDRDVDASEKRAIVEGLVRVGEEDPPKDQSIPDNRLSAFITSNSKNSLQSPDSFLASDPDTWLSDYDYGTWLWKILYCIVFKYLYSAPRYRYSVKLHIVNDKAEHGVMLMQELNALLTKDEKTDLVCYTSHQMLPRFQKRNPCKWSWTCWLT